MGIRWLMPLRGRRVFSVWAWLALVLFGLFAIGGYDLAADPAQATRGVLIAGVAHLALGMVFLIANLIERTITSDAVHIAFVTLVLVFIAVGRPIMISELQWATGGPLFTEQWLVIRALTTFFTIGVPTLALFVMVETLRRHRRVRRTLAEVITQTERSTHDDEERSARLAQRLREVGIVPVLTAIDGARVFPFSAPEQASALEGIASAVVRPLGSSLTEIGATPATEPVVAVDPEARPRRVSAAPPLRILAPPPWFAPLALVVVTATALIATYGVASSLMMLLVFAVGTGLSLAARRVPTRQMSAWLGVATIIVVHGLIGAVVGLVMLAPAPIAVPALYWATTPTAFAAFAALASLVVSARHRLAEDERLTAALVTSSARRATAASANLRDLVGRFRRAMDPGVHDRIVSTAMALREGVTEPRIIDDLMMTVADDLESALEPAMPHSVDVARDLLDRALEPWSSAIEVQVNADAEALGWFGLAPARTEVLLEAVVEALSNAIRHGGHGLVSITIVPTDAGVRLSVHSPGLVQRDVHFGDELGAPIPELNVF